MRLWSAVQCLWLEYHTDATYVLTRFSFPCVLGWHAIATLAQRQAKTGSYEVGAPEGLRLEGTSE